MCTVPLLRSVCRECYSEPQAVYQKLKQAGMDLVTVTDHDSIEAGEALGRYEDFFLSEEVTCRMPTGTDIHVGVYDINERQHVDIQRRRDDLSSLLAYLHEQEIFFSLNHAFSHLTGRRKSDDFDLIEAAFPVFEVLNGHILPGNNRLARQMAELTNKAMIGGSDGHTLHSAGAAFTEVPRARNRAEFLEGLRLGKSIVYGSEGSYWKLTRDVFSISAAMMADNPLASIFLPLTPLVPAVTLLNYILEISFARRWRRRVISKLAARNGTAALGSPLTPEEVGV